MLILLFLFALFRHLHGAPLTSDGGGTVAATFPASHILPRTDVVFGTRNISDIVISCLATIFACTWTAIHPNIPSPADSPWNILKRRVVTTIYCLLAPELITIWAWRQYCGAKRIEREYNQDIATQFKLKHGMQRPWYQRFFSAPPFYPCREGQIHPWTTTHGFFVQMGGFVLAQNGIPVQAMTFSKSWLEKNSEISGYITKHKGQHDPSDGIKEFILAGVIDVPKLSKAEIEDRSKGDIISKTVVILQTTWFISQCIARWSTKIPVTELELVTLGFAMLNGITYALWWHKPQNVGVPMYLEAKAAQSSSTSISDEPASGNLAEAESAGVELQEMGSETTSDNKAAEESDHLFPKEINDAKLHKSSYLARKLQNSWRSHNILMSMFTLPLRLLQGLIFRPLNKLQQAQYDYVQKGDLRVPMFFAEPASRDSMHTVPPSILFFVGVVGTLFGCVHLVPSFFGLHYASPTEMRLWKISAAIITVHPCFSALFIYTTETLHISTFPPILIVGMLIFLLTPVYVAARLALIVLSFLSLRDLPENTLRAIDWISSIPHL